MSCLCGDTHCSSCGPAQGNYKCPLCRAWADDGCEHIGDDGDLKPEFLAQAEEQARQEALAEEELVRQLQDEEALADEYWRSQELP